MISAVSPTLYYTKIDRSHQDEVDTWNSKRKRLIQENTNRRIATILQSQNKLSCKSTPFIRFLCRCMGKDWSHTKREIENKEAILTIWNPTDEQVNLFQEGCIVRCKNLGVKSSNDLPQLVARENRNIQPISPQPSSVALRSLGFEPRNYFPLMYLEAACDTSMSSPIGTPEYDCAGCLIKVTKVSSGLFIYLMDESKCIIRIEREIDHENDTPLSHLEKAMLNLPPGACLFFRDIRILRFDPWEETIVGVWTEFSSQEVNQAREVQLKLWYSTTGHIECNIASQRLSCGIIDVVPDRTAVVIGRISALELLHFEDCPNERTSSKSLHEFNWGLIIDTGITLFRAVVSIHHHSIISRICNPELLTEMERKFEYSELRILEKYFSEQFRKQVDIFRFVIDSESECILHVKAVEALALSQVFLIP